MTTDEAQARWRGNAVATSNPEQDLNDINEMVSEQSHQVGQLQQDLQSASWWRRGRVRRDLDAAIRDWLDLVHVQESIWRQVDRGLRR
jgi:hypothetical protein